MNGLFIFIQLFSAILLIVMILLHSAKGEGLGGIGGQAKIFGSQKGLEEGLDKLTYICAVIFIASSLILTLI